MAKKSLEELENQINSQINAAEMFFAENEEKSTVNIMTERKNLAKKDKAISAKVNSLTYSKFKAICQAQGLSPNAAINKMMVDYVRLYEKEFL